MLDFFGIKIEVYKRIETKFKYLQSIIDSAEVKRYPKFDKKLSIAYEVTIRKHDFYKTFYINIFKKDNDFCSLFINGNIVESGKGIETNIMNIEDEIYVHENPHVKEMLDVIKCKNNKCPICESEMRKEFISNSTDEYYILVCPNNCYKIDIDKQLESDNCLLLNAIVAGVDAFYTYSFIANVKPIESILKKKVDRLNYLYVTINYWKTNDRYLIKILQGGF